MQKLGLIAGNRKFPLILSEAAKKRGYYIVAVAIKGDTSPALKKFVDKIFWVSLAEFSRMFEVFKQEGVKDIVMAGQISPCRLFSKEIKSGGDLGMMLSGLQDKRADTIFLAIAERLKAEGFELQDSSAFVRELMPAKGLLSAGAPSSSVWEDINFGLGIAKAAAGLDIGQTIAIKSKAIVAVEAMEGTDNLICRAGRISRGGFTIVKVSKPNQDLRFDIPVVGLNTVKNLIRAGGSCLAIEA